MEPIHDYKGEAIHDYVESIEPKEQQKKIPFVIEFLINISTAVVIFLVIYFFVAQPHQVEGNSMQPNYESGDYVLTEKISGHFTDIKVGDVVVFEYPKNPSYDYIKRVIAVPGETVEISKGQVYVNDTLVDEPYLVGEVSAGSALADSDDDIPPTRGNIFLKEGEPYTLQAEEYIVMGDNRNESSDSREWGPVTRDEIVGKVFFRYWPLSSIGLVNGN